MRPLPNFRLRLSQILQVAVKTIKPKIPNQKEIGDILKEELEIGISANTERLSKQNGYFETPQALEGLFNENSQKALGYADRNKN